VGFFLQYVRQGNLPYLGRVQAFLAKIKPSFQPLVMMCTFYLPVKPSSERVDVSPLSRKQGFEPVTEAGLKVLIFCTMQLKQASDAPWDSFLHMYSGK